MNRRPTVERRGFSLVELLVVVACMAVMIAVLLSCVAAGMRAWDSGSREGTAELAALVALLRMEQDVAGAIVFGDIPLEGGPARMVLPALVQGTDDDLRPGAVVYHFDRGRGLLLRNSWVYPGGNQSGTRTEQVLESVRETILEYRDPAGDETWAPAWNGRPELPSHVRVTLVIEERGKSRRARRILRLPAAGQGGQRE